MDISIEDIRAPEYTPQQRDILAYGENLDIKLDRDDILREASEQTGLHDFGDQEFLTRLDLLVDEWSADAGLNDLGRLSLRNKLLQHACSRLLIQDTLKRHPEIHEIPIEAPIIVAGLPRSGTTHLLNLMAADTRLRSLPLWESYEPVPRPGEGLLEGGVDPRYQRCADAWAGMQLATPYLAAMHPMNPDHIHEELELMGPDFASYNYEWLAPSPRWRDHYYATDQRPHYEYMKTVLKLLLWQQGPERPRRWVLKCPQHLEQLKVLMQVFPDATVAVTHRDPVSVIQSTVTMLGYSQRMNRHQVEADALLEYWVDRIEHLLRACVAERDTLPAERSIDVPFHAFMDDELGTVAGIFECAGLAMDDAAQTRLQQYIDNHPRGKHGRVVYHLEKNFGVSRESLYPRFEFYFERFPVKRESA
ncbi:MAG: sulfotransferase [Halieaceae bacterium]|jgi:hypothetical protein|nr:sulfotransferase [Halieaceae bacterium]